MKIKGWFFAFILVFMLFMGKEQVYATETRAVSDAEEFHAALADESVSVIEVNGTISKLIGSGNDPLIISRPVTIRGGILDLWYVGIVLGADVTFQNVEINLSSAESNAIVANGYTLTLDGVSRGSSTKWDTHIFCGGIVGYNYANIPAAGDHGEIIVKGKSYLGNIYAGNMVHSSISESQYVGNATIFIDSTASGTIGNIYGSGGREAMGEGDGNAVNTGIEYGVDGNIHVTLYDSKVRNVVGYKENLVVEFHGSGNQATPVLDNISSLEVVDGFLMPASNSSFASVLPEITVGEQGILDLSNYGDMCIGNFNGGGTLVLGKEQKLTVEGNISGSSQVFIGSHMFPEMPADEHTYIEAVSADADDFVFNGSNGNPNYVPVFVSNNAGGGMWTTIEDADSGETTEPVIKVTEFVIQDYTMKEVDEFWDWIEMPMTIAYTPESNITVDVVELEVKVNDREAEIIQDGEYICYKTDEVYCYPYSMAGTWIVYDSTYTTVPRDGSYHFEVTVPAEFTESGSSIVTEATLILGDVSEDDDNGDGDNEGAGDGEEGGENGGTDNGDD